MALGIIPSLIWCFWRSGHNQAVLLFNKRVYLSGFVGIFLSIPMLMVVDRFVDATLVSNRSYGAPIGSALYLLLGYVLWYFAIYRGYSRRFRLQTQNRLKSAP
jgi:hypothetical protein